MKLIPLEIQNYKFHHVCEIIPKLDSDNNVLEFLPQSRYENSKNLPLNNYGKGRTQKE